MKEITITTANFEQEVLQSEKPILVDFWASWCGPCKMIAPIVSEIAEEYKGKLKVGKLNIDEEPVLSIKYGVMGIPTLILFENGEIKQTLVGYRPKEELARELGLA